MDADPESYLSLSLEDLIKANKKGGGKRGGGNERNGRKGKDRDVTGTENMKKSEGKTLGRGRGRRGASRGTRGRREAFNNTDTDDINGVWKHDMYDGPVLGVNSKKSSGPVRGKGGRVGGRVGRVARVAATAPYQVKGRTDGGILSRLGEKSTVPRGTPVTVSRLSHDVEESEVVELFSTVGAVVDVSMQHDCSGRSTGTAVVTFEDPVNAGRAVERFHSRTLDGIPMSVTLGRSTGSSQAAAMTSGKVGAPKDGQQTRQPRLGGGPMPMALAAAEAAAASTSGESFKINTTTRGRGVGRGAGRRRGRGGGRSKTIPSSMDLDTALEDYHTVNNQI